MPLAGAGLPLAAFCAVMWVDRVGDERRVFRRAVYAETGYPLGAAISFPVVRDNLRWLERPVIDPETGSQAG
ncbi:hypothetical protein [Hoeflea sp.]|uniref:hypothetical protein n=1 Tax=Hoeflea sp. TaxID=1940281 RepID=UPI003B0258CB